MTIGTLLPTPRIPWTHGHFVTLASVNIPETGAYRIEYRVASLNGGGGLRFEEAGASPVYGQLAVPATGGWQNWVTISHTVNLTAGTHRFGINAISGGWNINWFRILRAT